MEKYAAYQPPKRKGFYLDPRTKILFMAFITTLMTAVCFPFPHGVFCTLTKKARWEANAAV